MTKAELINEIKNRIGFDTDNETYAMSKDERVFYTSILKILEQEPCEDAISRQALLEFFKDDDYVVNEINNMPPVLPKHEQSEWIKVEDRLPEKNVWVLVTVEQNDKCHQEIMRRHNYKEAWTDNIDIYTDEIIAWMPIPKYEG